MGGGTAGNREDSRKGETEGNRVKGRSEGRLQTEGSEGRTIQKRVIEREEGTEGYEGEERAIQT
jgi:hypothetical protein